MELLDQISQIAKEIGASQPYICGGIARDKLLGIESQIEDIDITTGDQTIHSLAKTVAHRFPQYKFSKSGDHYQLVTDTIKIDFSSNFICPGAEELMIKAGIKSPTKMQIELYSRDFTCNALLMTMDLKTIKDPIGLGVTDIKSKQLRTCLPASLTLGIDNKRLPRVIYLSCKLGFDIDKEITEWIKNNPMAIKNVSNDYITKKLNKAIEYNPERTVELIGEMGLWPYIPINERLMPYFSGAK